MPHLESFSLNQNHAEILLYQFDGLDGYGESEELDDRGDIHDRHGGRQEHH